MNVFSIQISSFVYTWNPISPTFGFAKNDQNKTFWGDFPTLCCSPVLFVLNGKDRKKCETKQKLLLKPHSLG